MAHSSLNEAGNALAHEAGRPLMMCEDGKARALHTHLDWLAVPLQSGTPSYTPLSNPVGTPLGTLSDTASSTPPSPQLDTPSPYQKP